MDRHFTSICDKKRKHTLQVLAYTRKFPVVSQIYHICSLDRQCRGKNVTKFSRIAIYVCWIVSVAETM